MLVVRRVLFTREIIIFCDTFCSTFHFGVTRKEWLQQTFLSLSGVLIYILASEFVMGTSSV